MRGESPIKHITQDDVAAYLAEKGGYSIVDCYSREKLRSGNILSGPSLVEGTESTVLIPGGWRAELDGYNNLIIRRRDN